MDWKLKPLGSVLKYEQPTKYIVETTNYDDSYKTPVLTAGQSFILGYTDEVNNIYSDLPVIIFDDFTTAIKYVDFPFKVKSSAMKILKADSDLADIRFLFYLMQTVKINNAQHKRYWISKYSVMNLRIPPLATQKKIVAILDEADILHQLNKNLIAKYDALTQSLFLEMFGDPVANPMGWEVKKMKEISTKIHSGNTPKGGSKVYVDKGIVFLRSQNVWKNRLELDNVAYIDEETQSKMMKSSLKNRDILMTKTGRINTENSSLGRAAMFEGEDDTANVNGHVYLIRLKEGVINEFVLHILTTNEYREHIRRVCVGGIDKRQLNKNHLEDFPIIYPPIEKQRKFITKLETIRELKQNVQQSLQKSEDLFNSLLQKAFKGELVK